MSRLPTIGDDTNNWGSVLNDFLGVALNANGTPKGLIVRTAVSGNYTILASDYLIAYTSTASSYTATLPAASSGNAGQLWIIKDESGGAATHPITIATSGGNIDGVSSKVISTNYGSMRIYSNGTNYFTLPDGIVKSGLAVISGGATLWGVPTGGLFVSETTSSIAINTVRYTFIRVEYPITLTAHQFEVSTAPASNANVRIGIYRADSTLQPTGAPLYDNGGIAVASGFTGVKTTTGLSVALSPGMYLVAVNCDVTMTMRVLQTGTPTIDTSIGANAFLQKATGSQTYGAYPSPGTSWTTNSNGSAGLQHPVVFQWTE